MNARTYKTSHSQENMNKSHIPLYVENLILTCGILFFSLQVQAQKSDTQLSFSIRNASLEEFIKYLENSTGFSFIYGEEVKINRRITLEVKQKMFSLLYTKCQMLLFKSFTATHFTKHRNHAFA